jgi:hypothetical protein
MKKVIINKENYIEIESEEDWENLWDGNLNIAKEEY